MSNLIVDFAHRRTSFTGSQCKTKAVTFSPMSEMTFYERPQESDASKLYYTAEDYRAMRTANLQATQEAHRRYLAISLASSKDLNSTEIQREVLDGLNITGIENVLSPSTAKKFVARRKQHWRAVLQEQAQQDESGEYDPDMIACASQRHSKWAVKRAQKIASYQSKT